MSTDFTLNKNKVEVGQIFFLKNPYDPIFYRIIFKNEKYAICTISTNYMNWQDRRLTLPIEFYQKLELAPMAMVAWEKQTDFATKPIEISSADQQRFSRLCRSSSPILQGDYIRYRHDDENPEVLHLIERNLKGIKAIDASGRPKDYILEKADDVFIKATENERLFFQEERDIILKFGRGI